VEEGSVHFWNAIGNAQNIEQNHATISIVLTIIFSSTFIPNKAQSASSVLVNSTAHGKGIFTTYCSGWL